MLNVTQETETRNIYEKMLAVMESVRYLSKDIEVSYKTTGYTALSESKVTGILREKMIEQRLVMFPVEMLSTRDGQISHVDVRYRIVNAENPSEFVEVVSCGDGFDTQDKGAGKAMTYALKYAWLRTFAIPTGDETDAVTSAHIDDLLKDPLDKLPLCEDCGQVIMPHTYNGKTISPVDIANNTYDTYGRSLCWDCATKAKLAKYAEDHDERGD